MPIRRESSPIASLELPAGSYVVTASFYAEAGGPLKTITDIGCQTPGGTRFAATLTSGTDPQQSVQPATVVSYTDPLRVESGGTNAELSCFSTTDEPVYANSVRLTAVQVATLNGK